MHALRKPATRMAKRKLKSGSSFCSCREHSMVTKAAPWLKPRMPSNGPSLFTASLTTVTLSSTPRLFSHCCWALKLLASTSENHQPLESSSPAGSGPEPFSVPGASEKEKTNKEVFFSLIKFHRVLFNHKVKKKINPPRTPLMLLEESLLQWKQKPFSGFSGFCVFNFNLNLSQVHYYSKLMTSIGLDIEIIRYLHGLHTSRSSFYTHTTNHLGK